MKYRLLNNWSIMRVLYLLIGIGVMVDSIINKQWLGIIIGGYFGAMGLFGLGCAGGQCATPYNKGKP